MSEWGRSQVAANQRLLWLVAVGFFLQTLDTSIINTALPSMARGLHESPLRMQSVVIAYALTMAMLIPASGWIADRFGTRRVFMGALALFALGSLACALSASLPQLVAARVLQGLGGALLLPVGRLSVLRTFPRNDFLKAMSFVTLPGLVGPLLGPTLGGWLVQVASWHWIFLINLPVALAGVLASLRFMPDVRVERPPRFDAYGYLLLAWAMVAISLALEGSAEFGLREGPTLLLAVSGLAALTVYWLHAARHPAPLFSTALFRVRTLSVGLLGNLFCRLGSGAMPFLIPLSLQVSMGYTPLQAGLTMLPAALAGMSMKRAAQVLIPRFGYRPVLVVNTVFIGLLMASFGLTGPQTPVAWRVLQLAAFGAFNSLQFSAMNTIALKDLDASSASSGNSLLSMVQMLAMSFAVAAASAVLAGFSGRMAAGAEVLPAFQATFAVVGLITVASSLIFWQLPPDERTAPPAQPDASGQG